MWPRRKEKNRLPDLFFSKFFLIFCVVIFLIILFGLANGTIKNYRVDSEITGLQKEIQIMENQNQDFVKLVSFLKSESFIEQEAKLKLGLKKPGENLVVIPQNDQLVDPESIKTDSQLLSNPAKWWEYFFE